MKLARDSFIRCYLEAWAYWIGLNLIAFVVDVTVGDFLSLPTISQIRFFADPFAIIAFGVLVIPLFAAILVGVRRNTERSK